MSLALLKAKHRGTRDWLLSRSYARFCEDISDPLISSRRQTIYLAKFMAQVQVRSWETGDEVEDVDFLLQLLL